MKKFALSAIAAAALFGGAAHAYTVGTFSNGLVVPNVIHNGSDETTAVGLINRSATAVGVYWTFFNQNSGHEMDGCFVMTANQYRPVTWQGLSTGRFANTRGYLVLAVGATTAGGAPAANCDSVTPQLAGNAAQLAGNAFQVRQAQRDVAVVPVIDGPLTLGPATTNIARMNADSLTNVAGALTVANPTQEILARYATDAATTTRITVWSTGSHRGTHTVDIYNDNQQRTSGNFALAEDELSWFDPGAMESRPTGYTDGYIVWNPGVAAASGAPTGTVLASGGGSVFVYSTIEASAFGAAQTLLGAHR